MGEIDLKQIIINYKLDPNQIADLLFPENKKPIAALNRILAKEALMNSKQVYDLAKHINVPISELYSKVWSGSFEDNYIILKHRAFEARIDRKRWTMVVSTQGRPSESVVLKDASITLSELLETLNKIVYGKF